MLGTLIQTVGVWFLIAVAIQAVTVFVEQAGAARSPEEAAPRRGAGGLAILAASALSPGLLLAHGFLATRGLEDAALCIWAIGLPIGAVLGGSLHGAMFGALALAAAPLMR
jgi:hypothetical protein